MEAVYYAIYEINVHTAIRGEIVLEGIVSESEGTIYPKQETGIEGLPYECELHHFNADIDSMGNTHRIETCNFIITRDQVIKMRTNGDKIQ